VGASYIQADKGKKSIICLDLIIGEEIDALFPRIHSIFIFKAGCLFSHTSPNLSIFELRLSLEAVLNKHNLNSHYVEIDHNYILNKKVIWEGNDILNEIS
jgi:hypothetical protein